jgi:hypothetical protein
VRCEDAGVAANAAGILAGARVTNGMQLVFDRLMLADSLRTEHRLQQKRTDEVGHWLIVFSEQRERS